MDEVTRTLVENTFYKRTQVDGKSVDEVTRTLVENTFYKRTQVDGKSVDGFDVESVFKMIRGLQNTDGVCVCVCVCVCAIYIYIYMYVYIYVYVYIYIYIVLLELGRGTKDEIIFSVTLPRKPHKPQPPKV